MPGDVGAAAGLGDRERADQLAGQRRADEAVDQVGVAARRDVRQRDPAGEERRPSGRSSAPASNIASCSATESSRSPPLPPTSSGKATPSRPSVAGGAVQRARDLAGVLPLLQVRRDLAADELGGGRAQRVRCSVGSRSVTAGSPRSRRAASAATRRAPWPAGRSASTRRRPAPSRPWMTTLTAPRWGSSQTSTSRSAASGSSAPMPRGRHHLEQPLHAGVVRRRSTPSCATQRPTLASPPLSPERAWTKVPSGRRRVSDVGAARGTATGGRRAPRSAGRERRSGRRPPRGGRRRGRRCG